MDNDTQFDLATIRMAYFALLLSGRKAVPRTRGDDPFLPHYQYSPISHEMAII